MKDLLIYTTVANNNDNIRLESLFNPNRKKHFLPSLSVMENNHEVFIADNEAWLIDILLPALQRFISRTMLPSDQKEIEDFINSLGNIYEQIEGIEETVAILEYAIKNEILTK